MANSLQSVPRAPGWLPLFGHALQLKRDPLGFVKSLRKTGDLVRVDIGTMPVIFVNSAALAHAVMVGQARRFHKGRFFDRLRDLVGNGLPNADGEQHRSHRRLMQPMFHKARIAGYAELMSSQARDLADSWGGQIDVNREMADFSVSILAACMFSSDIGTTAAESVKSNVPIIIENLLLRTISPKILDRLPTPPNRRFDAAARELHQVLDDVIAAARQTGYTDRADLLSTLLAARDADTGDALTDAEVRDELGSILFAGTETTASTLAWAFHEIAANPEVEERLLAEIDSVVGNRQVTFEDVAKLDYIRRVVDETNRLHGVTLLMRRTIEPVELGGVTLPTGTEVAFSLYAMHQDPRTFPEPQRFDPDRWLPERSDSLPREAFVPFGSGNRMCIGDAFSKTAIIITLATVLARLQLRPVPGHTPREAIAAVPHPDNLPMTVVRRPAPVHTPA